MDLLLTHTIKNGSTSTYRCFGLAMKWIFLLMPWILLLKQILLLSLPHSATGHQGTVELLWKEHLRPSHLKPTHRTLLIYYGQRDLWKNKIVPPFKADPPAPSWWWNAINFFLPGPTPPCITSCCPADYFFLLPPPLDAFSPMNNGLPCLAMFAPTATFKIGSGQNSSRENLLKDSINHPHEFWLLLW